MNLRLRVQVLDFLQDLVDKCVNVQEKLRQCTVTEI